jgi:hypothetical protein
MLSAVLRKRLINNVSVSPRGTDKDSGVLENDAVHIGTYVTTFRAVVTLPGLTELEARRCSTRRYVHPTRYSPHHVRPYKTRTPIILS